MKELQVFQNSEFGELGVLELDGKIYFPATACAKKLGHENPARAVRKYCKGVTELVTPTSGGSQTMRFIPEGDLYRLIVSSKLPSAEKFERWVFEEVMPTIRKTGGYGIDTRQLVAEITAEVIKAVIPAVVEIIKQSNQVEQIISCQPTLTPQMLMQPKQALKIETFPKEFIRELDDMFFQMQEIEEINYSAISRYCYAKGHPVSNVSIKRYFDRYFRE